MVDAPRPTPTTAAPVRTPDYPSRPHVSPSRDDAATRAEAASISAPPTAGGERTSYAPPSAQSSQDKNPLTIKTGPPTVTLSGGQVFIHPKDRGPIDSTGQTNTTQTETPNTQEHPEPTPATPTHDKTPESVLTVTRTQADEPPIFQETKNATREPAPKPEPVNIDNKATDQPATPEATEEEPAEIDKPSLDDLFKDLGKNPSAKISKDNTIKVLQALPDEAEVEVVFGEGTRRVISEIKSGMRSASDIPDITIYGEKEENGVRSWYVDLKDRTDEGLAPEEQDIVPRTVKLVKTPDSTSEDLIEEVNEQLAPKSMQGAASQVGGIKHVVVELNWTRYLGPDYEPELQLESGREPDAANLVDHRVVEYGSFPQAMGKLPKAGVYQMDAEEQFGGKWTGEVYVYDHNRPAWQAEHARRQQEKK